MDCYVLGFIFYEILIGRNSFAAQFGSLENGPASLWLKWHADRTLKARPLNQLRPNLGHFASLIDGMIEKDPGKRIGNISRVLSQFSTVENHTVYRISPGKAPARKLPSFAGLRKVLPAFHRILAVIRRPPVAIGLGVLVALCCLIPALIPNHEKFSRHQGQRVAPASHPVKPQPSETPPPLSRKLPSTQSTATLAEPLSRPSLPAGPSEEKRADQKLAASPILNPANFFENGQNWTVERGGWWAQTQGGYSFLRASRGTFVFDILKPSGRFARKKISIVVNYREESNRVLYTIDRHSLHRNERVPGFEDDHLVAHGIPSTANYRLTLELLPDRVIVRNAAGKTLDNLRLANPGQGKVGFSGKVTLRVVQAKYAPDSEQ